MVNFCSLEARTLQLVPFTFEADARSHAIFHNTHCEDESWKAFPCEIIEEYPPVIPPSSYELNEVGIILPNSFSEWTNTPINILPFDKSPHLYPFETPV